MICRIISEVFIIIPIYVDDDVIFLMSFSSFCYIILAY